MPIIRLISFLFKNQTKFKTKEFNYVVPEDFDPITKFLMKFNIYELKERSLVEKMLKDIDIIEAGAGIGLISMYLKKKTSDKNLVMIEPNKKMNEIIKKNFILNGFSEDQIIIENYGLSDEIRNNVPFQKFESDMANTISVESLDYNFRKKDTDYIDTININSVIAKYDIKKFQLVLDIEGEEANVLTKNNEWLKNCRTILLENHLPKEKLLELNNYILSQNFQIVDKKENVFLFKNLDNS